MRLPGTLSPLIAGFFFLSSILQAQSSEEQPLRTADVTPSPQDVSFKPGSFRIAAQTRIVLGKESTTGDEFSAEQINAHLTEVRQLRLRTVDESSVRKLTSNYIFIGPPESPLARTLMKQRGGKLSQSMKEEGYFLHIDENGIVLIADSPAGRFYGAMTLLQLMQAQKRGLAVPALSIHDWPLQKMRGITDDLSRGQVSTIANFKKIIRFLARYKLNVYSPYIEDIFAFKNHPLVGKNRGALTAGEVKELDAYAKNYHVELIPIFETLGHWENILVIPEYVQYAEFPGAHTVDISNEKVYGLLDQMIGELASAFSSPFFNMAADESWDVGLGANKARVASSDLATVHAEHYKRLFEILKKHKKKPLMYGDIILNNPDILAKIPKDVTIVDWQYWVAQDYPSPEVFQSAAFPYVVSPAVWNFTGPFPNYLNTLVNIRNLSLDGYRHGSMGLLTSNWNDYGGEALRELNYYGYAWTAECAWQPERADVREFNRKFFSDFLGSPQTGQLGQLVYTILSDPYNQFTWHELWRHPLLSHHASSMNALWRIESVQSSMPLLQKLLEEAGSGITRNKDHLEYLRFITRLNLWFAKKLNTVEQVRAAHRDSALMQDPKELASRLRTLTTGMIPELEEIKDDFRKLWLKTNREDNLAWLLERYDQQKAYWQEIIEHPAVTDPTISSLWIYHPKANPGSRDTSATQVPKACFRGTFQLSDVAAEATLQLIGDTHAKVSVNGVDVGGVFARRSLSLTVEHQRVKWFDVSGLVKPGKNVIALESANYDERSSAGVNILMNVRFPAGASIVIGSDSTFKVAETPEPGWKTPGFDDASWLAASPKASSSPVIAPNFATKRKSWIER